MAMQDKILSMQQNLEQVGQHRKSQQIVIKDLFHQLSSMTKQLEQCQIKQDNLQQNQNAIPVEQESLHSSGSENQILQEDSHQNGGNLQLMQLQVAQSEYKAKEAQDIFDKTITKQDIDDFEFIKKETSQILQNFQKNSLNEIKAINKPQEVIKTTFSLLEDLLQARQSNITVKPKDKKWKLCLERKNLISDLFKLIDSFIMKGDKEILNHFNQDLFQQATQVSTACVIIISCMIKFSELQQTQYNQLRSVPHQIKAQAIKNQVAIDQLTK